MPWEITLSTSAERPLRHLFALSWHSYTHFGWIEATFYGWREGRTRFGQLTPAGLPARPEDASSVAQGPA